MIPLKILAISAASGRVGYVFLADGQLADWCISRKASQSTSDAVGIAQQWMINLRPNIVVTEKVPPTSRKSENTKEITAAIAKTASHNYVLDVSVSRPHEYKNKYEEAAALVALYPDLKAWQPKQRRIFDKEPYATVLFEALAMAMVVSKKPATTLAAGMG